MRKTMRTVMGLGIAGAVVMAGSAALGAAGSATANLGVGASVANKCTITATAIDFGAYDPVVANASADLDGEGTLSVACTKGATATIALDGGLTGSREMSNGSDPEKLQYELYQESARTTVWDETSTVSTGAAPSRNARDFKVYGRVAGGQDVPDGTYTDTVTATVNF